MSPVSPPLNDLTREPAYNGADQLPTGDADFPPRQLAVTPVACPSGLAVIRDDPEKDFGVLNLPGPANYFDGNFHMMQQTCHSRPIVQGNTARHVVVSLLDRLERWDLQAQQRQLAAAKVKYIVIYRHNDVGWSFRWHTADGPKDQYPLVYPAIYDGTDVAVLRVY